MVEKIFRSGKRLMTTLNSILNISELESSRFDVKLTELNLAYCVKDKLYDMEKNAIEKNLTFEYIPLDKNIFIYADEKFLMQIVESLVDNAIKYTEIGGVQVIIDSEQDDGKFWGIIKVADTGIGIPPYQHELIFEEFRQASEGFNRNFEGSGLGLTLAKKMTSLLGGEISVESDLGKGSTFIVKLPGYIEFSNGESETTQNEKDEFNKINLLADETGKFTLVSKDDEDLPTLLLVEDNYINSDVTIMFLKGICKVDHTIDGENAINMASLKKYDAILMDINLGGKMNGIEALKEIRSISDYETTPIVALTGYAMGGDKEKLISEGFDDYMSKPFEKEDIVNLVKLIIKK
jgi:CheY-like chemotaxis protein